MGFAVPILKHLFYQLYIPSVQFTCHNQGKFLPAPYSQVR